MTTRPQGFWDVDGVWRSLRCQNMKFPGESFVECLKNSQIYVFGDSNSNRMYGYLVGRTFSKPTYPGAWPYKAEAVNKEWDIKLKFYPHEYPLFLGQKWEQIIQYGSVEKLIDGIPSTGRQLVIVHYYLHMSWLGILKPVWLSGDRTCHLMKLCTTTPLEATRWGSNSWKLFPKPLCD